MSEAPAVYGTGDVPVFADDMLLSIARQAEARIDAVIKIKQIALKVTNPSDWTDQQGKPYLQASGSEKIANLFNISWRIDEPTMEEEADGTITYNYKGTFTLAGRSIEVEGSRSSRDEFFKKYLYDQNGKRIGEKPLDRRDLKMAAMTNLLGNGITRLLGIRNLTWDDLKTYAGITQDMVKGKVIYRQSGKQQELKPPQSKGNGQTNDALPLINEPDAPITEPQLKAIHVLLDKLKVDDKLKHTYIADALQLKDVPESLKNLTKGQGSTIIERLNLLIKDIA
jgi:hypothetical protein